MPPAPIGTVRAGVAATVRAYLARYPGVSVDRLIRDAGIDPQRLGDADAAIDQARWIALLEAAAAETGNACVGIELALQLPWKDLGVYAYVLLHSPDVGTALANSVRYLAVQQTGGRLAIERSSPRAARFTYTVVDARVRDAVQHVESVFGLTVRLIREATRDPRWAPREIAFRHAGPANAERHARLLGAPVRFGRRTNAMTLAPADLARPFVAADPGLLPVLERHAAACLRDLSRAPRSTDELRGAIVAAIGAGDVSIEAVAARLGTGARSVQRRLQAEGRSYKALVDEARLALSQQYLADPSLSLTETAYMLGYSDLSSFSRAFRRWTGSTALDFRRRHA
ncbi:MAG: AraC family transcriptional regulator [Deltaproteobacteria bacterium]|nr:AraC family transcriptional regulator [Deltaproteobacteria bacterium]